MLLLQAHIHVFGSLLYYRKCKYIQLRLLCKCVRKGAVVCGEGYVVIIAVTIVPVRILYMYMLKASRLLCSFSCAVDAKNDLISYICMCEWKGLRRRDAFHISLNRVCHKTVH